MKLNRRYFGAGLSAALALPLLAGAVGAQEAYPAKPVTVIVPFNPGPVELITRMITDDIGTRLNQRFVVETMPGASGLIGTEAAVRAADDGYTILGSSANTSVMLKVTKGDELSFDPVEDFVPIVKVFTRPYVLYINPSYGINSVQELIDAAKAEPDKFSYSSSGVGAHDHLTGAQFAHMAGIEMLHVPYGGSAPAIQAAVSNEVSMHFGGPSQYAQYGETGMLTALGVAAYEPFAQLPQIPPIADTVPGFASAGSVDIFVPAGTPDEIIQTLRTNILEALQTDEIKERIRTSGELSNATPEEIAAEMREQAESFSKLVEELNIELQ